MKFLEKTNKEEFSVAIPATLNLQLCQHLLRADMQEDVTFALYKPSMGVNRFTGLIYHTLLPQDGERTVHGNVDISPDYFRRACKIAVEEKSGIVLLHSHTGPGWQGMSTDDIHTEKGYASTTLTLTGLPIIGLTLGTDKTWSARVWENNNDWFERKMSSTVRVVGNDLNVSYNDTLRIIPEYKNIYKRTITVWGKENHNHIARLHVGIVGLGSVGSIVAESLARMGIERFTLLDFDEVQEHNLDRLLGATVFDMGHPKVHVTQRQIQKAATATQTSIRSIRSSITEREGYDYALDCDVLFSCVDRPWPRHVLNHLAYNHLIPVIDGGIQVRLNPDSGIFEGADWQLQTVGPEKPCLACLGAYNPSDVSTEQAGQLDNPTYLAGLPKNHSFKRNENIFPFSVNLASLEVMQFIEMVTHIGGVGNYGPQRYTYNEGYIRNFDGKKCEEGCFFSNGVALGDSQFEPPIGFDHSADLARKRQIL